MNIIDTLLLVSCVISSLTPESPYFYDKELEKLCFEEVQNGIASLCKPANCIIVDPKTEEINNQVVFIEFRGAIDKGYEYFIKGGEKYVHEKYSELLNTINCQSIINEIVDKIKSECETKKFDIFFTINLVGRETEFFNKDNIINSIDTIRDCFKRRTSYQSVVKYYTNNYEYYFRGERPSFRFSKSILGTWGDSVSELYFFPDFFLEDHIFERLKSSIKQHEGIMMNKLKERYNFKDGQAVEIFILYIFSNMHNSLKGNIGKSQAKFLLKLWKFLKNKKGFYRVFIDKFDKKITEDEKLNLNNLLHLAINENRDILTCEGLIDVITYEKSSPKSKYLYVFMNAFSKMNTDTIELSKNTIILISKVYYLLTENKRMISAIVLFDNYNDLPEFDNLSSDILESLKEYIKEFVLNYSKYLEAEKTSEEEIDLFANTTAKCLENISKMNKSKITVLKELNDDNFMEYGKVINRYISSIKK